jgi:hypothetical protein
MILRQIYNVARSYFTVGKKEGCGGRKESGKWSMKVKEGKE